MNNKTSITPEPIETGDMVTYVDDIAMPKFGGSEHLFRVLAVERDHLWLQVAHGGRPPFTGPTLFYGKAKI